MKRERDELLEKDLDKEDQDKAVLRKEVEKEQAEVLKTKDDAVAASATMQHYYSQMAETAKHSVSTLFTLPLSFICPMSHLIVY